MVDRAQHFRRRPARLPLGTVGLAFPLTVALALAFASSACTKSEAPSTETVAAAATATPSAAASPDAAPPAAEPIPDTAANAEADATVKAASAEAGAGAPAVASSTAGAVGAADSGAATCGKKPLPDCPLQAWMKTHTNPAVSSGDLPALAIALDKVVTFAPAGYTNWASIAKDGAKAARAGDMTAAKASCRTCHDQYKDKYKKELRAQKI